MSEQTAFDGKCAFATALVGPDKAPEAKPKYTVVRDGVTYGFFGWLPMQLFKAFPGLAARAQKKWAASPQG
jgi:hypothetical protein